MISSRINLDANASHGVLPEVWAKICALKDWGLNPSSIHLSGQKARALLEDSRERIRSFLNIPAEYSIMFTSGATEANNLALHQVRRWQPGSASIVSTTIEHAAILAPLEQLDNEGYTILLAKPNSNCNVELSSILNLISADCKLISCMFANNETGTILPVAELSTALADQFPNILLHSDAVQAIGRLPLDLSKLKIDLLSISGHKFGALAGVGALIASKRSNLQAQILGGPQESRFRAGTENLLGIISMGWAAEIQQRKLEKISQLLLQNKQFLLDFFKTNLDNYKINAAETATLNNTISLTINDVRADDLVVALDVLGVNISYGAACSSGKPEPSHVLLACGLSPQAASSTVRLSLTSDCQLSETQQAAEILVAAVHKMRKRHV